MNEPYDSNCSAMLDFKTKAQVVADTANLMLMDILARCRQGSHYKHYFDIAAIGYSGKGIYPLLPNGRWTVSPSLLATSVKETQRRVKKIKHSSGATIHHHSSLKVWIEPSADGDTPMGAAIHKACEILYSWRNSQPSNDSFPPTIINITDGEATDITMDEVENIKNNLAQLGTSDGEPTLFNLHITNSSREKIYFPSSDTNIPNEARMLFELSSTLPEIYNEAVARESTSQSSIPIQSYRAFSYNLPITELIGALQIGTTTTQQIYL